jgi:menaquinol-cytochrome c reductase iron-sulfur subunit
MDRRRFLSRVTLALSGGIAVLVGAPILGFLLAPLFANEPDTYVPVADLKDLTTGDTTLVNASDPSPLPWAGQTAASALWVRRLADRGASAFQVFNVNCTHLGCPVDWRADAKLFVCPCHGGVYYADGTVAGGPPPRPLFERAWKVENGKLLVKTQRLQTAANKTG